ncbi:MAG: DNA polymerase III subunit alpha [Ignavibacteria bacterium]|nr:DNA polymerase III subunit alpha [Ignavibacteria bacterium]
MAEFIHLHNHSHYSLLDAICTIDELVDTAKMYNMPALALTDHGVMYGSMEFYTKAKKAGIKPIVGCEFYIKTKGSRFEKGVDEMGDDTLLGEEKSLNGKKRKSSYKHLVLLAKDFTGYKNLIKLCSAGHKDGFYYKPRIDVEILKLHSEGLVCLSACAGGVVASHIVNDELDLAYEAAEIYKDIFGDDFYLEIQNHGLEIEEKVRAHMPAIAKKLGLKLIATNDIHYIKHEHHIPHNIFLYISTDLSREKEGKDLEKNLRYGTDQVYFKSAEEMCELFKDYPEAIKSTLEVADKCNLELPKGVYYMPEFPIPENSEAKTLDEYLKKLAYEGLKTKIKNVTSRETERLDNELDIIMKMNFSGYFLIVADFVNYARSEGIYVGPGRGSAAGSLVCYALGITNVNPLEYNLLFERFLNPERISMPDIDIDFQDDRRDEVINYSKQKYGENSVSQIATFNRLKTKAVLKDVGRVLNYPFETMNEVTKHVPSIFGRIKSLKDCYEDIPEFREYFNASQDRKKLLRYSMVLENLNKNVSMHASGVVIAPSDITDYVPVAKAPQSDDQYMTQYDMKMLEEAGLIKMDFLGLKELKILQRTVDLVNQRHNLRIEIDKIPLDDEETFKLFSQGNTIGVFQFSKPKMREYLMKLKPKDINDLAAMNALYRPGPMDLIPEFIERKHGLKKVTYLHQDMEQVLKETYGVIVFQEQVMQLVRVIAGYSLAKADLVRRAMGKKDEKLMKEQQEEFIKGAVSRGYNKKTALEIFKLIMKFADYGFNKSHSVAYSILAYQTAWLKTHYPIEFMTSQLNTRYEDTDEMVLLINECRRMNIKISLPDVNECSGEFLIKSGDENTILFGLNAIKNVGRTAVENIVEERNRRGKFRSFIDFISRVDTRVVNKKTIEALICSGAFDSLESNRKKLFDYYEAVLQKYGMKRSVDNRQSSLFAGHQENSVMKDDILDPLINYKDWSQREKLSREKAVLGLYISSHPLNNFEREINSLSSIKIADFSDNEENIFLKNELITICGIISNVQIRQSKKGNRYATFLLEDFTGQCECLLFGKSYEDNREVLVNDTVVTVNGRHDENATELKLIVSSVKPLIKKEHGFPEKVLIRIDSQRFDPEKIYEIKKLINPEGNVAVSVLITNGIVESEMELHNSKINFDEYSEKLLSEIFGKDNVIFV